MRKWTVFMCSAATGTSVAAAFRVHSWWFSVVNMLLAAGLAAVAWYHLDKMEERP